MRVTQLYNRLIYLMERHILDAYEMPKNSVT